MLACAKTGMNVSVAFPPGYGPDGEIVEWARREKLNPDSKVIITNGPAEALQGADAVYTDVWTSMGQEDEQAERIKVFEPYQLNAQLLQKAKPDAIALHCLPAHRGEEITEEVIEGPQSAVFDQAENRLHVQKAVLALVMGD